MLLGLDLWVSHVLANSESFAMGDAKIWNDIIHNKIDAELLVYGSSRAWVHFDPEFIFKNTGLSTYNFGVDGQSFDIQNLRHELYLKEKSVKFIIYSVDVNTLNDPDGLYNDDQFLPFLLTKSFIRKRIRKYNNFSFIDYNVPFLRYMGRIKAQKYFIKDVLNMPLPKMRNKGFAARREEWNDDFAMAKREKNIYIKQVDKNTVERFDVFLQSAKRDSIMVIMMYAPEHILGQSFVKNRSQIVHIFDSLAQKNNIPFYDYSKGAMNKEKDFFYNSLHLNAKGVKEFNKLYINDLKNTIDNYNK